MYPVSPICASTVEQTAELPCLWLPPRRRNGDCNRPTTSASANTNMWIPHVAEQCLLLHPLVSLSDLGGQGVLVHGSGGFARCMFQPYAVREGLGLLSGQESILLIALFLSSGVFQTSLVSLQLHDTVLSFFLSRSPDQSFFIASFTSRCPLVQSSGPPLFYSSLLPSSPHSL